MCGSQAKKREKGGKDPGESNFPPLPTLNLKSAKKGRQNISHHQQFNLILIKKTTLKTVINLFVGSNQFFDCQVIRKYEGILIVKLQAPIKR
jgi:hypothetical protein